MNRGLLSHPTRPRLRQRQIDYTLPEDFVPGESGWGQDDHFDTGDDIDRYGTRFPGAYPWEPVNISSSVFNRVGSRFVQRSPSVGMSGWAIQIPPITSQWAAILGDCSMTGISSTFNIMAYGLYDTVTTRLFTLNYVVSNSGRFERSYWTSPTTFNSAANIQFAEGSGSGRMCFAISCDGTNFRVWHSNRGARLEWHEVGTGFAVGTALGGVAPNRLAFFSKVDVQRAVIGIDYHRIVPLDWVTG